MPGWNTNEPEKHSFRVFQFQIPGILLDSGDLFLVKYLDFSFAADRLFEKIDRFVNAQVRRIDADGIIGRF